MAVVVAAVYLVLLRLVDHNEKEPVWALLTMVVFGAAGALVLSAAVSSRSLNGTLVLAAVSDTVAIFISALVGVGVLHAVGRLRGWSEINGVVDGAVYGAAVGLGFATGQAFVTELHTAGSIFTQASSSPLGTLWPTLLLGLSYGVFGSFIGAGLGAAVDSRRVLGQAGLPLLGLAVAFGLEIAYLALAHRSALAGSRARVQELLALGLPLLFFVVLIALGLRSERAAIESELAGDPEAATPAELALLTNPAARRAAYIRRLVTLDSHGWLGLRSLQNRQVSLAFAKRRARRIGSGHARRRAELEAEVANLRAAVAAARHHLATGPIGATGVQSES